MEDRVTTETTLNATETLRWLRITRETRAAMLAFGELRGFQRGKIIRVSRQSVEELLRLHRESARTGGAMISAPDHGE